MFDTVIQNGSVVLPNRVQRLDVAISDGKIAGLLPPNTAAAQIHIDAGGLEVFPGMIDTHVHFNEPGFTWRETFACGTAAAAAGGVTTVLDMPLQNVPALTSAALLGKKRAAVASDAHVDYAFWGGMTGTNGDGLTGLLQAGVVAFKVFLSPVSSDYRSMDLGEVRTALQLVAGSGVRVGFHCEDFSIIQSCVRQLEAQGGARDWRDYLATRPLCAELIAVYGVICLSRELKVPVHICHVSHPQAGELIRQAQRAGVDVTAETCSHYLVFSEDDLIERGSLLKCAPPLREADARDRLWDYLSDGTLSCVCSDHSPCAHEEKDLSRHGILGCWGGISGVQSTFQLMYSQWRRRGLPLPALSRLLSEGPARVFGLGGRKGAIAPGLDADLVLVNPAARWVIRSEELLYHNAISAFVGMAGTGLPVQTLVRGKTVFEHGAVVPSARGCGTFIRNGGDIHG